MRKKQDTIVEQPVNIRPDMNNNNTRGNLINVNNGIDDINDTFIDTRDKNTLNKQSEEQAKLIAANKNKKKILKIALIIGVIIAIAIIAIVVYTNINKDTTLDFKTVDVDEYKSTDKEEDSTTDTSDVIKVETVESSSFDNPATIGKYHTVNTVVNTKIEGDTEYKDYEASYYFGVTNVLSGYDTVIEYINEYNKTGKTVVNIPSKENFEQEYKGMTLVMVESELYYPSNYPTNLGENKVYKVPNFSISLTGTYKDDSETDYSEFIVVDKATFKINEAISITDKPEHLVINTENKFRYIFILPIGAEEGSYIINLNCDNNSSVYKGEAITN